MGVNFYKDYWAMRWNFTQICHLHGTNQAEVDAIDCASFNPFFKGFPEASNTNLGNISVVVDEPKVVTLPTLRHHYNAAVSISVTGIENKGTALVTKVNGADTLTVTLTSYDEATDG